MTLLDIQSLLGAEVLCGEAYLDREVHSAYASDFMSDVLAFAQGQGLLITGMVNPQVVRTADMLDMKGILFVRGKRPGEDVLALARDRSLVILCSSRCMFNACGTLYSHGLAGE